VLDEEVSGYSLFATFFLVGASVFWLSAKDVSNFRNPAGKQPLQ